MHVPPENIIFNSGNPLHDGTIIEELKIPIIIFIYINPTNVESGTRLYNDKDCVTDIKYVQNRLIMYSGGYPHQGYGHFGSSKEQGRLTVNLFLDMTDAESQ